MKKELQTINLQLFAADINTNVTGDSGLSVENKTYYDMALIDEATPNLIHGQFGQKRNIPKGKGKKIEFRKYMSLGKQLTPLTEGVTPRGQKLEATSIEAEAKQYGGYVGLSDVLDLTAIDDNVLEATTLLGNQAGLTFDTIHRNAMHETTNEFFAPSKADGSVPTTVSGIKNDCYLTVDTIKRVVAWLKKNNAPKIDGYYVAIVHPFVSYDIQSDEAWVDAHKYANPDNLYTGEIGRIAGVRFVETSEAKVYENNVFGTLIFGANAYGTTEIEGGGLETIIKQLGSAGTEDPLNQRSTVGWKGFTTAEILVPQYICKVYSKSKMDEEIEAN
jgi:N4-gp56 family major capsid protein